MNVIMRGFRLALLAGAVGLLGACGGGGGDGGGGSGASVGVLMDAEVQGVTYRASPSGLSGVTDAQGRYRYRAGDTMTFSLGSIVIGTAPASGILTPRDLAESVSLPHGVSVEDVVTNIAIFLQTFDSDGVPGNGIQILPAVGVAAEGLSLDFARATGDFLSDGVLVTLTGDDYAVVDEAAARDHLVETQKRLLNGSWQLVGDGGAELAVISFFPDGTYLFGIDHRDDPNCYSGVERGSYSVNPATGRLTIDSVDIDETGPNGDCGLWEDSASEEIYLDFVSATTVSVSVNPNDPTDSGTFDWVKVPSNGVTGSWVQYDGGGSPISVLTLLASGKYVQVEAEIEGGNNGLEFGTWSRDATTGAFTSTALVDGNGPSGPSNGTGIGMVPGEFGFLQVSDESDPMAALLAPHPYQLKLAGNTADSRGMLVNSACPSAPVGWLYTFGASDFSVEGSDGWSNCEATPTHTETWSYTEFDAPFNCGDAICDFHDMNKVITGTDDGGRSFSTSYQHVPGSREFEVVKEITGGDDVGTTYREVIVLGEYVVR